MSRGHPIPGNELAESLAKAGALGLPEARESTTQLDERDLLRTIKTQCLKASELKSKKEEEQVNALIYILGEKAEDALISFNLTDIEINNYEIVVKKFEEHFIGKRNVIFERAQFNRRYQQDGEAVEEYIRVLHKMAENCNYGSLKEEMIRDRIVVGVKNLQLLEKLQLEPNLTLERAIQAACQTECVKQQQTILRSTTTQAANVDQVYEKKKPPPRRFNSTFGKRDASKKSKFQKWSKPEKSGCIRCGASKFHPYKDCPAKEVKCHKCKKVGHFAKVCYNKTVGQVTQGDDYHFVGTIYENGQNSNDWKKLCKPDIQLLGPRQVKLHVIGKFTALIEKDGRSIPGEIFVVPQLMQPLLSGKASESLNLIKRLQSIEKRNSLNPFEEYPKIFTGLGTLQGSYTIKLKDESRPHAIYTPRRIPIPLLNKTKEQLDQMQPTDWCAPMVIVPKPSSNDLRICVDLTALNKFVKREHYPIPSVEYTLAQMGGAKLFSKLDANSGFWQIPLSEESSGLTTFLTPFGRYRFKRLPFGISSAPEVFQRKMSNLLESQSGVNCHMDDIVIWGATQEEHDERLRCVLRKLQDSGLALNKEKCIFSVKEIKFLGHLITERGVLPDPNEVQTIREFPSPSSISEVRRFLGMVNFTGKFIQDLSTFLYPLNQLLVKRNDWRWDSAQEEAFEKVKNLLSTSPTLTFFETQSTNYSVCRCLFIWTRSSAFTKSEDGCQKAVAYASRTMSETEKRWAQIEKESLAIVWACERFQDYLMGNTFSIETDHKPLIPIFSTKNLDEMTPRILRL
ncbi:K02A2.6-like [Cordylochernes scorpioides]|uniref:K02A2.6-like n=1 Tax=Cordylochernes scorpioides TaxID=51811 RepID=A0ABY6K764_9ARAC|nr:K02A2.6-like [Cordylochernes scorpioides]